MTLDELIVAALAGGSRAERKRAEQELARRLNVALRAHFRSQWRQHADVDDLVQDTLMMIFATKKGFQGHPKAFLKWVYTIARNKTKEKLHQLGRSKRLGEKLAGRDPTPERGLSSFIMLAQRTDLLVRAMGHLTEAQQQAVDDYLARQFGEKRTIDHATLQRAWVNLRKLLESAMADPPALTMQATPHTPT
jgi:DNA-directed RNA polymerase specialized sigma24 family protein